MLVLIYTSAEEMEWALYFNCCLSHADLQLLNCWMNNAEANITGSVCIFVVITSEPWE